MKTEREVCSLGVTDDTFAAWHDATLDQEKMRRISEHVPTCPGCQLRLVEYTQLDQAIRSQHVPLVNEQFWQDVRAGISGISGISGTSTRSGSTNFRRIKRSSVSRRQLLGSLGALAAAILVVVGFLRVFQLHASTQPTAKATATTAKLLNTPTPLPTLGPAALPVPGTPPNWQTYNVPVQFIQQQTELGLAVAPSDGTTAYICNPFLVPNSNGKQQAQIWMTHDRGAQWAHMGDLPALGSVAYCSLDVDAFDSSRVLALLSGQNLLTLASFTDWFVSNNGGATWTMIAQGHDFNVLIQHIATNQGKTYAIYTTESPWPTNVPTPTSIPNQPRVTPMEVESHLAVSSDGLHTWQPIDGPILTLVGLKQYVKQFWALVGTGGQTNLLADVGSVQLTGKPSQVDTLWVSHDGGAQWTQLPAPQTSGSAGGFVAQTSADGHTWYICGITTGDAQQTYNHVALACSTDAGQTWVPHPALRTCKSCSSQVVGIGDSVTSDGSLIGLFQYKNEPLLALYRLPANSSQWQYLGQMPDGDNGLIYAPTSSGTGYLWSYGGSSAGNDLAATIGGTGSATGVFYTAAYPA